MNQQHAFVIEAGAEEGIEAAKAWLKKELGMRLENNPDISVLAFGLLSVEDVRRVVESASQAPFFGDTKAIVIAASRVYHEAQNALLKLFEEPPRGTHLFLILPTLGSLLPTLRSRVQVLTVDSPRAKVPEEAEIFIGATKEKRSALIKKLTSGRDEEERRENREEALAIVTGIEALAAKDVEKYRQLLDELQVLRGHLHDRSAPVKMILEHLAIVVPKHLV